VLHIHVYVIAGHGSNHSSTFHLHGYNFLVLGSESLGRPVDVAEVKLNDSLDLLSRNLMDAPRKDTVVVPNKGYTIIRVFTDNPG
jgi:FtsP/CotA-like multicopper oxidase with cupredoxin domain